MCARDSNQGSWIVARDFNCVRFQEEKMCVCVCGLSDRKIAGVAWTWTNKQQTNAIACKLNRVLVNDPWYDLYPNSYAITQKLILNDHAPILLSLVSLSVPRSRRFKYFSNWNVMLGFLDVILEAWQIPIKGCPMFQLVLKLKLLKQGLIQWAQSNSLLSPSKVCEVTKDKLMCI